MFEKVCHGNLSTFYPDAKLGLTLSDVKVTNICHSRCFGIRGGYGKSAFKLAVKLSVELGYFFLSLRL
jgi:hypothetical protein